MSMFSESETTATTSRAMDLVFVDFEDFKRMGRIRRSPKEKDLPDSPRSATPMPPLIVHRIEDIDVNQSLLIFVSHRWMASDCPDINNVKYRLCCDGIDLLKTSMLNNVDMQCYIWIDFSCINQEDNPALELQHLREIISVCDCMFTPIVDEDPDSWQFQHKRPNLYADIMSPSWRHEIYGYINRAWCRVEMLYAANIMVGTTSTKLESFKAGLRHHQQQGRRPHFLFMNKVPDRILVMPPFQHSYFQTYDPQMGHLTVPTDNVEIVKLVNELRPYMRTITPGYSGARHEVNGTRHGHGTEVFVDGGMYEGNWENDKIEGYGISHYSNGNFYEGQWHDGKKHGQGTMYSSDGDVYQGSYVNGKRWGQGTLTKADGTVQKGRWEGFTLVEPEEN